jgi:hypothetical protein
LQHLSQLLELLQHHCARRWAGEGECERGYEGLGGSVMVHAWDILVVEGVSAKASNVCMAGFIDGASSGSGV